MRISEILAEFVVSTPTQSLPPLAMERAKMSLASTIASAAVGYGIESARLIREIEADHGGTPQASVWFAANKLPSPAAARINATASDAAASDDSDMRSIAHIGTIASTVSMAIGERLCSPGNELLAAMVLGYEVAGRMDEALTPGRTQKGFHGCVSTIFAAAACTARLMKLDQARTAQALSLAATSIGGLASAADTSCSREYHAGLSALLGTQAALAAQRGFQAEQGILEHPKGFFHVFGGQAIEDVTRALGDSWDIVTDMAVKLIPGGHPYHAIAEAAMNAAIAGDVDPAKIDRVVISAIQLQNWRGPQEVSDLISAAHSAVYFVAAAIADRGFGWDHIKPEKMQDERILAVQRRVEFDPVPPPLPDRFPHRHGGTITIIMKNGEQWSSTCRMPRGSGPRGISWEDIRSKFKRLAPASGLPVDQLNDCFDHVRNLELMQDVNTLARLLQTRRAADE